MVNTQLKEALIKAEMIVDQQSDYKGAYVTLKWEAMKALGITHDELNALVLEREELDEK